MKIKYFILCFSLFPFLLHFSLAQNRKAPDPALAKEHFSHKNYVMALPIYKDLVKQQPKSVDYNLKTALCYLNTNINKAAAIPFIEFVCAVPNHPDEENIFQLGKAYQYAYRFDEAITAYEKYMATAKGNLAEQAKRQIETCNNAKELIKYPLDVNFINLGKQINTEFPDYNPLIPADESYMAFTTRRPKGAGEPEIDGYYASDIFISLPKEGIWQKPKDIGTQINTRFDEQAVDITANGKTMVVYIDHVDTVGNIYYSENNKNIFSKLVKFGTDVNSGFETSGSTTADHDVIVFASKRADGFGETDLYMIKKLPNGNWAIPQILGNQINTKYKEDYPHITADCKTLYFASQGHSSMGGFDIFKSVYNTETNTWSYPQNLGYPINTPDDDMSITFTNDSCYAYLSASRDGGFGDLDLYKIKFNKGRNRYCIVSGYVTTTDTMGPSVKKQIIAIKTDSKETLKYTPVKSTGKYVMALTPGKYTLTVKADGYQDYNLLLNIIDVPFLPEQKQDFQLTKDPNPK